MDWTAFGSAIVGGVVMLVGSMALERFRARTAAAYGLAQAKWDERRAAYVKVLTLLQRAEYESLAAAAEAKTRGGEPTTESASRVLQTLGEVLEARVSLPLWLDEVSSQELSDAWKQMTTPELGDATFYRDVVRYCAQARSTITKIARNDLQFNLPGT